jgi:protein gp37
MATNSKIEWTDSTFNPWIGCTKVSLGCKHCYAETLDKRQMWDNQTHWGPLAPRRRTSESNWKQPLAWNKQDWLECLECGWRGPERQAMKSPKDLCPECEGETKPTRQRVFCASLADVFEENDQLIDWRLDLFDLIKATPNLDWLILTKRVDVAQRFFRLRRDLLLDNIQLGTSIEDQKRADERIPALLSIPARIRFLSVEPLLGPVKLLGYLLSGAHKWKHGIHWVIVGGESGPNARPMHPQWARDIRDQCQAAGVPFFFKQWGEWAPIYGDVDHNSWPMKRVGKKAAGRLLDGQEWSQFPVVESPF